MNRDAVTTTVDDEGDRAAVDGAAGWRTDDDGLPAVDRAWWENYRSRLEQVARESGPPTEAPRSTRP